mgnify:CR=1 FL=1
MVMKKEEEIIVYQNPDPLLVSRQGIFPGISLLPNNDLLIIFSIGQAFDSSDQRAFVTKVVIMEELGQNQKNYIIIFMIITKKRIR